MIPNVTYPPHMKVADLDCGAKNEGLWGLGVSGDEDCQGGAGGGEDHLSRSEHHWRPWRGKWPKNSPPDHDMGCGQFVIGFCCHDMTGRKFLDSLLLGRCCSRRRHLGESVCSWNTQDDMRGLWRGDRDLTGLWLPWHVHYSIWMVCSNGTDLSNKIHEQERSAATQRHICKK